MRPHGTFHPAPFRHVHSCKGHGFGVRDQIGVRLRRRTDAGHGQVCASSACAAHLDSLSDNVELIAAGLDSCTGEDAGLAQYGDVKNLKRSIKGLADECGHTLASAQTAEDTGANVVAIVGGAVGGVAALAVVIGVVFCCLKKKAQATKPPVAGVEVQSVKVDHI